MDRIFREAKASYLNRIRFAVGMFYFGMGLSFATWASRIPDIKTTLTPQEVLLIMLGRTPKGLTKELHFAMVPPKQYRLPIVTKRFVKKCKSMDIKVFVWTINDEIEYQKVTIQYVP